jgi:hypothetical protein
VALFVFPWCKKLQKSFGYFFPFDGRLPQDKLRRQGRKQWMIRIASWRPIGESVGSNGRDGGFWIQ